MNDSDRLSELLTEIRDDIRALQEQSVERHEKAMREYEDLRKESEQAYAKERRTSHHFWLVIFAKVILLQAVAIVALAVCLYMKSSG